MKLGALRQIIICKASRKQVKFSTTRIGLKQESVQLLWRIRLRGCWEISGKMAAIANRGRPKQEQGAWLAGSPAQGWF